MKRIFLIVLDSLGIGEAPDAHLFSDVGANTLRSAYKTGRLSVPSLKKLGLGNIDGVGFLGEESSPTGAHGRLRELSAGKDTTIGHWEIAGILSKKPLPTYPNGFPSEVIDEFTKQAGVEILCNMPYSGTDVIRDYGKEHEESGKLIVYTSADSVFQIAANEAVVPIDKLYDYCRIARGVLVGKHSVGRVIARPFIKKDGKYVRTANRRDFSIDAPKKTMLDAIKSAGLDVISVGKISDIFAGRGITRSYISHGNTEGLKITSELQDMDFSGLAFVNLVDFDSQYGHRQDPVGYAEAINEFDTWLPSFINKMREDDLLIITADHGCDPSDSSTDHTREFVPLLICGDKVNPLNLGTMSSFATISKFVCDLLNVDFTPDSFDEINKEILL